MEVNYLAIIVCAVASMVVGFVWYGFLFKKAWMQVMGIDMSKMSPEECKELQKGMGGVYLAQFILSLITAYILAYHIASWAGGETSIIIAICTWFGFVMTTVAGSALWSGKPKKLAWKMFFIVAGAQLVTFIAFGFIINAFK